MTTHGSTISKDAAATSAFRVQSQIRRNAEDMQEYLADLGTWEKAIKKKDKQLSRKKQEQLRQSSATKAPRSVRDEPVQIASGPPAQNTLFENNYKGSRTRASCIEKECSTAEIAKSTNSTATKSLSGSSVSAAGHTYDRGYGKWDKFDVDAALASVDDGDAISEKRSVDGSESETDCTETEHLSPLRRSVQAARRRQPEKTDVSETHASLLDVQKPIEDLEREERERGNAFFGSGYFEKAANSYTRCIRLNSKSTLAFSNRAMAYIKMKEFIKAEADCDAALRLDGSHVKSLQRRAAAGNSLGKHRAALRDLLLASELDPDSKQIRKDLSKTRETLKAIARRAPKVRVRVESAPLPANKLESLGLSTSETSASSSSSKPSANIQQAWPPPANDAKSSRGDVSELRQDTVDAVDMWEPAREDVSEHKAEQPSSEPSRSLNIAEIKSCTAAASASKTWSNERENYGEGSGPELQSTSFQGAANLAVNNSKLIDNAHEEARTPDAALSTTEMTLERSSTLEEADASISNGDSARLLSAKRSTMPSSPRPASHANLTTPISANKARHVGSGHGGEDISATSLIEEIPRNAQLRISTTDSARTEIRSAITGSARTKADTSDRLAVASTHPPTVNTNRAQEGARGRALSERRHADKALQLPKSGYQFESMWKSLEESSDTGRIMFLRAVPPSSIPRVFKHTPMEVDLLEEILERINDAFMPENPSAALRWLRNLSKASRFDMTVKLLEDSRGRRAARNLLDELEKSWAKNREQIRELREKYQC